MPYCILSILVHICKVLIQLMNFCSVELVPHPSLPLLYWYRSPNQPEPRSFIVRQRPSLIKMTGIPFDEKKNALKHLKASKQLSKLKKILKYLIKNIKITNFLLFSWRFIVFGYEYFWSHCQVSQRKSFLRIYIFDSISFGNLPPVTV